MRFRDGERGVSPVIGFVFVFAFAIVLLSSYQATIVPSQNEATEFNHYTEAQNDFAALQAAFDNAGSTGDTYQATIRMGTQYPARALFLNPAPPTGQLSSPIEGDITLDGVDDPDGDPERPVEDICGDSQGNTRTFEYRPNYNELSGTGRFVFENGVAYRQIDGNVVFTDRDSFIDGTNIDLRPLVDAPSTTGSADTQEVTFEPGEGGGASFPDGQTQGNFAISFPSRLDADTWENEILADNGNVEGVTKPSNNVIVELDDTKEYTITCRAVGINDEPSNEPGTQEAGTSETTSQTNPSPAQSALVWQGTSGKTDVTFKNTGDAELQIEAIRYQFYSASGGSPPDELYVNEASEGTDGAGPINYAGNYVNVSGELSPIQSTKEEVYDFTFKNGGGSGGGGGVATGDFFVISIKYSIDGESTESTYFIAVTS